MKETIVVLCYHGTSVLSHTCYFQSCPYRVTGEELIVRRDTGKFNHTEFHYHVVNKLLCLFLCKGSVLKVSLNIDIKECGDTSNTHCSTVLSLDRCKISKVQPLECFFCVLSRLRNIKAIDLSHFFHLLQSADLVCDLLTKLEVIASHTLTVACCEVFLFACDEVIDSVKCNSSVITNDTSTSVSIRKSCKDLVVTCSLHLRCVNIKYTLVVCFELIIMEDIFDLVTYVISVSLACLLCHLDSAVWHESTFQRFVCLKTYNLLEIFKLLVDISRTICCNACNYFCLHIENAAFGTLFFLKLLKFTPEFVCCLCRSFQEGSISVVWCVVHADKVTNVDLLFPTIAFESVPLLKINFCQFVAHPFSVF